MSVLLFLAAFAFFVRRARFGLHAIGFQDESMHILGGRALNAGDRLYHDFVDVHGPGIFMMAQFYGAIFGWTSAIHIRLVIAGLAVLAGGAVATSPCLRGSFRWLAAAFYFGLMATVWLVQGLFWFSYYPISGSFAVITLAWFVIPAFARVAVPAAYAFAAGSASACLAFTSYSEAPSALLFSASGCLAVWQGRHAFAAQAHVLGAALAGMLLFVWLITHGDILGYLAFHVAMTLTAYQVVGPLSLYLLSDCLTPSLRPDHLVQSAALCFSFCGLVASLYLALKSGPGRPAATLSVLATAAGLVLLNLRGLVIFQNGAFLVSSIGLLSIAMPAAFQRFSSGAYSIGACVFSLLTVILADGVLRNATFSPSGLTREAFLQQPFWPIGQKADGPLFDAVRRVTQRNERILSLVYKPDSYWAADRLPISGIYEYLPFDALYAKAPWFGQKRDICDILTKSPPPVILFDNWIVWGRYKPVNYMRCVFKVLAEEYTYFPVPGDSVPNAPKLYVRSDRAH